MIYFTANTLFGSPTIIQYENRPFTDVEHMDTVLARNINEVVDENDSLYFLGNFCFGNASKIEYYRSLINCKNIYLVCGNHDKKIRKYKTLHGLFSVVSRYYTLNISNHRIIMSHFPMERWHGYYVGSWHLYGFHRQDFVDRISQRFCVHTSLHNYKPVSLGHIVSHITGNILSTASKTGGQN